MIVLIFGLSWLVANNANIWDRWFRSRSDLGKKIGFLFHEFTAHLLYFIAGFISYKMSPRIGRQLIVCVVLGTSFFVLAFDY